MGSFIKTIPGVLSRPSRVADRSRNPLWRMRRAIFGVFVMGVLTVFGLFAFYIMKPLPDISSEQALASHICLETESQCDSTLAIASASQAESDRELINSISEVPDVVIHALVATEDKNFYEHRGVNMLGIVRGVMQTAKSKVTGSGSAQGGSSITQQLVKNQYFDSASSFNADQLGAIARKPEEVARSIQLERQLASEDIECRSGTATDRCVKNEILRRYFNTVYYGRGVNGLKSAARVYFDKEIGQLNLEEAAYLAGVLRNPTRAEPVNNPDEAQRRIIVSLDLMIREGYITEADKAQSVARMEANFVANPELGVALPNFAAKVSKEGLGQVEYASVGSEYFVDEVWQQVDEVYPGLRTTGGLKVYTTMDPALQTAAYDSLVSTISPSNPDLPNTALVSIDSQGMVRALVGGYDYANKPFNFATARGSAGRQPGSLMKSIGLASAIDSGLSARSLYTAPREIVIPSGYKGIALGEDWTVKGGKFDDLTYPNYITLEEATWSSTNSVYAQLAFDIGPDRLVETAQNLGVTSDFGTPQASYMLGSNSVSVVDMASSYSTFERAGVQVDPRFIQRIEDRNGNVICWYPANGTCAGEGPVAPDIEGERAIQPETARQVNQILTGVVNAGTGRRAAIPGRAVAGKTGTSQSNRDAWFTGYTCDLTTSVWVGYDDNRAMENMGGVFPGIVGASGTVTGGSVPAHMWGNYMAAATANAPACNSLDISSNFSGTIVNDEFNTGLEACSTFGGVVVQPIVDPASPTITTVVDDDDDRDEEDTTTTTRRGNNGDDEETTTTTTKLIEEPVVTLPIEPEPERPQANPEGNGVLLGMVNPFALFQNPNREVLEGQVRQNELQLNETECMVPGDNVAKSWVLFGDPGALANPLGPVIEQPTPTTNPGEVTIPTVPRPIDPEDTTTTTVDDDDEEEETTTTEEVDPEEPEEPEDPELTTTTARRQPVPIPKNAQ